MRFAANILLILLASLSLGGCDSKKPAQTEKEVLQLWAERFTDGYDRSYFEWISATDPTIGSVEGFLLWRGTYRGVPIAVYSCLFRHNTFFQIEHPGDYPGKSSGVRWLRLVLAIERTGNPFPGANPPHTGPTEQRMTIEQAAVAEVTGADIDLKILGLGQDSNDPDAINIALLKAKVTDKGDGVLEVTANALPKGKPITFDMEKVLAKEVLKGPKNILPLATPNYTVEEFTKETLTKLDSFEPYSEPWWSTPPRGREMMSVLHPMWHDQVAIRALLAKASDEELANAIRVARVLSAFTDNYFQNLKMDSEFLGFLGHKSDAVRGAMGVIIGHHSKWPSDPSVLEPYLDSSDPEVVCSVLYSFALRHYRPKAMSKVVALQTHKDQVVRWAAEKLVRTGG
jgi:hypothetical protein